MKTKLTWYDKNRLAVLGFEMGVAVGVLFMTVVVITAIW